MKKSFKKAGAAVLSMSMLLAMGAVSMPTYAATTSVPGQIAVTIANTTGSYTRQGEGDGYGTDDEYVGQQSGTERYDYLKLAGVTSAKVTMYRVAKLTGENGWEWESYDNSGTKTYLFNPQLAEGFTSWQSLLDTQLNATTTQEEFTTSSDDLKSLANYLERRVLALKNGTAAEQTALAGLKVGEDYITEANRTAYLPDTDASLSDPHAATANVKGYYVIITETEQSGVLVQPVIISLKNGTENPKAVTLKGSTIDINKKITDVYEKTTEQAEKGVLIKDSGTDEPYGGTSAVVSKTDVVHYEITAQLPKYDPNVTAANIEDFVIKDIASDGITIDPTSIRVYLSEDDESAMTPTNSDTDTAGTRGKSISGDGIGNWYLTGATTRNQADYQYVVTNDAGNHGLTITITGEQMRERLKTSGTEYEISSFNGNATKISTTAATEDLVISRNQVVKKETLTKPNLANATTMENMYIVINYDATVNKTAAGGAAANNDALAFNRSYTPEIDNAGVTKQMWDAVGEAMTINENASDTTSVTAENDLAKQIQEAKILGTTRYNKTYNADTYSKATFDAFDAATKTALGKLAKELDSGLTGTDDEAFTAYFAPATDTADAENHRIQLMLAKDKYNLTLNGEKNHAYMTYGNRYSTGGDPAYDNANYTKLYSVDLSMNKLAESSKLTATPKLTVTAENLTAVGAPTLANIDKVESWVTADDIAKMAEDTAYATTEAASADATYNPTSGTKPIDSVTVGSTVAEKVYACWLAAKRKAAAQTAYTYDADDITAAKTALGGTPSDDQAKMALSFLYAENAKREANNYYSEDAEPEKVVGAIFHLVKTYGQNDNNEDQTQKIDLGYAVSDANGQLRLLQSGAGSDAAHTYSWQEQKKDASGNLLYVQADSSEGTTVTSTPAMASFTMHLADTLDDNEKTWAMLSVGDYTLEEVYAPTGFKKWAAPVTFTVTADKNGLTGNAEEYRGSFKADASATKGIASDAEEKAGGKVNFKYEDKDSDGTYEGVLEKSLYNYYLDTLPATGGIGTVLFTAGGISVILVAGALFVMYMKKRNNEEEE